MAQQCTRAALGHWSTWCMPWCTRVMSCYWGYEGCGLGETLEGSEGHVNSLAFAPNGNSLAAGGMSVEARVVAIMQAQAQGVHSMRLKRWSHRKHARHISTCRLRQFWSQKRVLQLLHVTSWSSCWTGEDGLHPCRQATHVLVRCMGKPGCLAQSRCWQSIQ